jgi:hypothetical protein
MFVFPYILLALIVASGPPAPVRAAADDQPQTRPVTCTFSNPSYSGHCKRPASATADQTAYDACQPILACLNDVQCTRTYCNATQIRGGWRLVSAEDGSGGD